jgi:hypothetical protein
MSDYKKALGIIDGDVMDAQESKVTTLVMASTDVVDLGIRPTGIMKVKLIDNGEFYSALLSAASDFETVVVNILNDGGFAVSIAKDTAESLNFYDSGTGTLAVQNLFGDITVEIEFL